MLSFCNGNRLKKLMLFLFLGGLAACSGEPVDQSSEAFSAMADVHDNPDVIADTADIDQLLIERDPDGAWMASVFDTDTALLEREIPASDKMTGVENSSEPWERKAYFGDLHVHTGYSFDGYAMGTIATPYDAYKFAQGEAIKNPGGFDMQLSHPSDFYAVTDHAMFLGLA